MPTDETSGEPLDVIALPSGSEDTFETAGDAFKAFQKSTAESADPATADPKLSDEGNAAPEKVPGENTEAEPEDNLPPIERPRSWSKDDDDEWAALPRARQEKIAVNERARETDINQKIEEAAAERKAAQAEREQAGQERKALAAKLPEVQKAIHEFLSDKYPDIKSMDDVVNMAREADRLSQTDPFASLTIGSRLKAWEADQQRIQSALSGAQAAQAGEARERESNLLKYRAEETNKLAEFVPEIKNPDELKTLTTKAMSHLKSFDFSDEQLNGFAAQGDKPFILSAGFQRILLNSVKYEQLKAAPKAIPNRDVPPVQRPGAARAPGASNAENVKALETKLNNSGSEKDAFALYLARNASRRAS